MKNYELLDMIGEAGEDYVLAAEGGETRPRFRWRGWVAAAACAALLAGVYPASQAFLRRQDNSAPEQKEEAAGALIDSPGLHSYLLIEEGVQIAATQDERKAPAGDGGADVSGQSAPAPDPAPMAPAYGGNVGILAGSQQGGGAETGDDTSRDGDASAQEASLWYDALLHTMRLEDDPEWYGGAWIDGDRLTVAIVDSFRTPGLEAQLQEAAGEGAALQFSTVKYSMEFLNGLMEPAVRALDGSGLSCGVGVDVAANCLGVDIYSDGAVIADEILAKLAHLDPGGDAIRVRLFTGKLDTLTDDIMKCPPESLSPEDRATPAVPGGVVEDQPDKLPGIEKTEEGQSARYDLPENAEK